MPGPAIRHCYVLSGTSMIHESRAFILHRHNYGETSRILRSFTFDHGRVDFICKGCRASGKRMRAIEPFRQYRVEWSGRSDLKTLRLAEELDFYPLSENPRKLNCGFYINELVSEIIRHGQPEPDIYKIYDRTLARLAAGEDAFAQHLLRQFEFELLKVSGYGLSLDVEGDGHTALVPGATYGFEPERGLFRTGHAPEVLASGAAILSLKSCEPGPEETQHEVRRLMRAIMQHYFPGASIQSRRLFYSGSRKHAG